MTERVFITHVDDYNQYANERYEKAKEAWKFGEAFPFYGLYTFDKRYGYVRYRVNEEGAILSARWARTKKELFNQ